jgi:hypothetical protein
MSVLDLLRKGFGYVLLSMGVSRPQSKPTSAPRTKPASDPAPGAKEPGPKA